MMKIIVKLTYFEIIEEEGDVEEEGMLKKMMLKKNDVPLIVQYN